MLEAVNLFPQTPHWCGFSPLWMRRCVLSEDDVENPLEQTSHTCGRSPVWMRMCRFSSDGRSKHLPQ